MPRALKYIILAATAAALLSNRSFRKMAGNYSEMRRLKSQETRLDAERASLNAEKARLLNVSDDYVERLARKDLNLVRKGEMEFRFVPPAH
ncbi:MAG: septum formation initiator family protein [Elusimicrobiales bacterium]